MGGKRWQMLHRLIYFSAASGVVHFIWLVKADLRRPLTYGSILTDEHNVFVARFEHLSKDAQCLLIRMVNRRGAVFNRSLFRYAEISDLEQAVDDLLACGQARFLRDEDYSAFAACLPKDALISGAKAAGRTDVATPASAGFP